jgi:diguanylate cyclase (GGDEF)-like protein
LFYLLPITLLAWFTGRRIGLITSIFSAFVWYSVDILSGQHYSQQIFYFWNAFVRMSFFIIVTLLLTQLKKALEHEKNLSHYDTLTGAISASYFYEILHSEINRIIRYKRLFTVAYMDLDNFKEVNDRFGHSEGDQVLRTIAAQAVSSLRSTDVFSRLGGDEFVILLPETDQENAKPAISKILQSFRLEMEKHHWPVTFSIGVMTFLSTPETSNELIKIVDDLMYSVKNNGKNAVKYAVYEG